jgi:predicted alpha/beta superfamily hydrolase
MMVVGIAYYGITSWREHALLRDQDLMPGGFQDPPAESRIGLFTGFFKEELFPLIETEYHGSPDDRAIFGFSGAGLFALHTMLTQPGMFRRVIAASCTWLGADDYLIRCEQEYAARAVDAPKELYLAVGGLEEEQMAGFRRFTEVVQKRNYPGLRLFTEILEGEKHSSGVLAKTFVHGLRAVFQP